MWKLEFQLLFQFLSENYMLTGLPSVLDMPKSLFSMEEDYSSSWETLIGLAPVIRMLTEAASRFHWQELGPLHNPATLCDCITTLHMMSLLARMPSHWKHIYPLTFGIQRDLIELGRWEVFVKQLGWALWILLKTRFKIELEHAFDFCKKLGENAIERPCFLS